MSRFIETIRVYNGTADLLTYHQARLNRSQQAFYTDFKWIDLRTILPKTSDGLQKLRITYAKIIEDLEISPYREKIIRKFHLVSADQIQYNYKYADRRKLEQLKSAFPADHDIILLQSGKLTDASYANLAFFDGHKWWTPDHPLLSGTRRAHLLQNGQISPAKIGLENLHLFSHFKLINAMLPFSESHTYALRDISLPHRSTR